MKVSIGIPTLNGLGSDFRLLRCLESIADCTPWKRFPNARVTVVDDGSSHDQLAVIRSQVGQMIGKVPGLTLLEHGRRMGIAKGWNDLVRSYPDSDVCVLLNDDVEVVDHWLEVLVYSLTQNTVLGMVSLNAMGALSKKQRASLYPEGVRDWVKYPRGDYQEAKLLTGNGNLLASQGYAFGFRRAEYDRVGGFDERYSVFYEECDLGVSMKRLGLVHAIASYPLIYHLGGATNSYKENLDASAELERSRSLFHAKWGKTPGELRKEFGRQKVDLVEWNTSVGAWEE